jgi:SCF-associated factor 1
MSLSTPKLDEADDQLPWFSGPDIKHITAQFQWITSYSAPAQANNQINHARLTDFTSESNGSTFHPTPLPVLENKTIIQIALGDHHHVALTSKGEVYTWGEGSNGQLGLGDGRATSPEPRQVKFQGDDDDNQTFIFGITAGGWHTGALALGSRLSDKSREIAKEGVEQKQEEVREDENEARGGTRGVTIGDEVRAENGTGVTLGQPFFRVGFAGRGAVPGRGGQGLRGLRWNRRGGGNSEGGPSDN